MGQPGAPTEKSASEEVEASGRAAGSAAEDERFMALALAEAGAAEAHGDVPVGAVVVCGGQVVGRGHNRREVDQDPLAHAEILALRQAAATIGSWRLIGCTLYVTLEPCAMCAGALVNSRVETLVFGTDDPKAGYCGSLGDLVRDPRLNHRLTVRRGIMQSRCRRQLRDFFAVLRRARSRDTAPDSP